MCGRCRACLDEALCVRCASSTETRRRIYMSFFRRVGWTFSFLEADLKTPIGRIRSFRDPATIRKMAKRGNALKSLADHQTLDAAIEHGRSGLYLDLTPAQYAKLRSGPR